MLPSRFLITSMAARSPATSVTSQLTNAAPVSAAIASPS